MASRGLGTLTLDLVARIGGFTEGLSKAERDLDKRSRAMEKRAAEMGAKFKAAGAAIGVALAAGAAAAGVAIKAAIDSADRLDELSARLGISTEKLSGWGYAAQLSGVSMDELAGALPRLSKAIAQAGDEGSKAGKLFKALGIDVKGGFASAEEILPQLADRFRNLNNQTLETALAMEVFGKSGASLMEFLNRGSEGIAELEARAASLGLVISQETAAAAAEFNDRLGDLQGVGQGLATSISAQLLPALTDTLDRFINLVREGDLAANMASVLSGALSAGAGILEGYNNAVARTSIAIGVLAGSLEGLREAGANFGILGLVNEGSVKEGFKKILGAYENGQRELDALIASQNRPKPTGPALPGIGAPLAGGSSEAEKRLARYFAGSGAAGKPRAAKGGKSDEEREADALARAYDSMNAQLSRQIALFGETGEAASVRYEIENGQLAKLEPLKQAELLRQAERLDQMRDEADVQRELDAVNKRREESAAQMLEDLNSEIKTLGMSRDQLEIYNNLKWAGVDAESALGRSIVDTTQRLQEQREVVEAQIILMDEFRGGLSNAITDFVTGAASMKDALADFADDFARRMTQLIAERWMEKLFGQMGGKGGGSSGDWVGSLMGLFFGGQRASGGYVGPGKLYEVNERGPELLSVRGRDYLMMGAGGGMVTPNHRIGGGMSLSQTFVVQGTPDRRTREQLSRETGRQAARAMARTGR